MPVIEHVTTENIAGTRLHSEIQQWTRQIRTANAKREQSLYGYLVQEARNQKGGSQWHC